MIQDTAIDEVTLEERHFSSVFRQLVRNREDIKGLIAYGYYKFHKISEIKHQKIASRRDKKLDNFSPNPDVIEGFNEKADAFLEDTRSNIGASLSKENVETNLSEQLKRIEKQASKKNFLSGVGASLSAASIIAAFPIALWFTDAAYRQPIGLRIIDSVATISIDKPTQAISLFVERLDDYERQRYVETLIVNSVERNVDPTFVLDAVIKSLDHRPAKDDVILQYMRAALKRALEPDEIAKQVYFEEVQPAAGPPSPDTETSPADAGSNPAIEPDFSERQPLD